MSTRKEIESSRQANERAAWIILNAPIVHAGLMLTWAMLWSKKHGSPPKPPEGYLEPGSLEEQLEKRESNRIERRRRRWRLRQWRISAKGNPHAKIRGGFHIIIFPKDNGWSILAADIEEEYKTFSQRRYETLEDAKEAAFDALLYLKSRRSPPDPRLKYPYVHAPNP